MKEPTCPKCRHTIDCWETVDDSLDFGNYQILCTGSCPNCETDYRWWEVYKFSHIEDLEEVK